MLKIENLSFSYNNDLILSNINSYCNDNEFISFIGPSGCGKTTLLNIIAGILKPDSGIIINSYDKISYVFQQDSLLPWLNVMQNIMLPVEIKNKKILPEDRFKALNILNEVGLKDVEYLYPSELSGGMKKRVEIVRALITEPKLLILDEPFSSLDILTREKLNVLLKNICFSRNLSVVLVTHSIEEACFLSNRIYLLSDKPSQIMQVFDNIKIKKKVDYFILDEKEEETENKIRNMISKIWEKEYDEEIVIKKIKKISKKNQLNEKIKNLDTQVKNSFEKNLENILGNIKKGKRKEKKKLKTYENEFYIKDKSKEKSFIFNLLIPFEIIFILFFLEFLKKKLNISDFFLPAPSSLFLRFIKTLKSGIIFPHLIQTIIESMSGFLLAFIFSIISGYLLSRSKVIYQLIMPYLISFNAIPSIALVPFLILWFGFSIIPKIIISIIVIFFPMLINNITAFTNIQKQYGGLMLFYKPDFKERFLRFEFPGSLLYIFAGVKVSITLSIIGAVVGEFQAGSVGLGSLILIAKANFDTELMFVGLIWLITLGLLYFWLATFIYKLITKRKS
jgi:NitT/TauT family transport system ATP-binding protein